MKDLFPDVFVPPAPPRPDPAVAPKVVARGARTLRVEFGSHLFSEANGRVLAYALIVAEDQGKDSGALRLPTWADVQQYDVWPPYQVNLLFSFFKERSPGWDACYNKAVLIQHSNFLIFLVHL